MLCSANKELMGRNTRMHPMIGLITYGIAHTDDPALQALFDRLTALAVN